jgi:hypothetical protein
MTTITSITLSYDAREDRIHMAARGEDARKLRLWLTQRLARRLVAALAGHLERAEAIPLASVRTVMMAQEQAQAVSAIRRVPRVKAGPEVLAHLVTNVAIAIGAEKMELRFDADIDCKPAIVLDRTLVRQWLSMLHRQFVKADWPLDVWPVWLVEGSGQAETAPATRH